MKFLLKLTFGLSLFILAQQHSFAQKQQKAPFNAVIKTIDGKYFGKISSINDSAIVITDKREVSKSISYGEMTKIKVFRSHNDIGYTAISGALALGTIAAAQSIDDAGIALAVGIGGTLAVATLSALLHNTIHGAEVKLTKKDAINHKTAIEKLSKYVVPSSVSTK